MQLNKEELAYGALFQCLFAYYLEWHILWAIPISAFLWALSGSESRFNWKVWRRLGCPLVSCIGLYVATGLSNVFYALPFSFWALCVGYGTPSTQPVDEGSALGRFYYWITNGNELMTNMLTRGTILALAALPIHIGIIC